MNRVKLSAKGLLLIGGVGIAATGLAGVALAAVPPSSVGSGPTDGRDPWFERHRGATLFR
jgi:hypothetical protein